jgi:hypothetical protein
MYFPFLRGKQFEMKALKDFFEENPESGQIIPIIEPVNKSNRALESALVSLRNGHHPYALILNPCEGDFKHRSVLFTLPEENPDLFVQDGSWIPGFICHESQLSSIERCLNSDAYNRAMLVFPSGINLDNEIVTSLVNHRNVSHIVVCFPSFPSPRVKRTLRATGKHIIYMEDCFITRKRNADYADYPDEPFSSVFSYYQEEGYYGFADYTALSSEVSDGGMLPYALAIHLTYKKSEDEIYIHHFVSDTNYDQTNIRGKFQEAAMKIAPFFEGRVPITQTVRELIERSDDSNGYPGLGYLKKLSVKNHLELVRVLINE